MYLVVFNKLQAVGVQNMLHFIIEKISFQTPLRPFTVCHTIECQHELQLAGRDTMSVHSVLPTALNTNYFCNACNKQHKPSDYIQFIFSSKKHTLSTKCYWDQPVTILSSCCHT